MREFLIIFKKFIEINILYINMQIPLKLIFTNQIKHDNKEILYRSSILFVIFCYNLFVPILFDEKKGLAIQLY